MPPGVPIGALPASPLVILSHNHYDHLDRWTVRRLPRGTRWLVPLGLGSLVSKMGAGDVRELDWSEESDESPFRLTCLPAQHWSDPVEPARNGSLWCSWLIALSAGERLYFAGDTGLVSRLRRIRPPLRPPRPPPSSRSAPTSRAGSCAINTSTRPRRSAPPGRSAARQLHRRALGRLPAHRRAARRATFAPWRGPLPPPGSIARRSAYLFPAIGEDGWEIV